MIEERIYVAGQRGMVDSAIIRNLRKRKNDSIKTFNHADLDLADQQSVREFLAVNRPTQVYLAAAKVGGIIANNTYPSDFIYQNLMILANVIAATFNNGVQKLLFLGSSCIYPRFAPQPMFETHF